MRAFLLILTLALWTSEAGAIGDTHLRLLNTDLRADRGGLLAGAIKLSPEQAEIFWPIQKKYQEEMDWIDQYRRELIQEFAAVGPGMSEEIAEVMVQQFLELEKKELEIRSKVIEKLESKLSPSVAADFYRIDTQLNLMIHLQTASRLRL